MTMANEEQGGGFSLRDIAALAVRRRYWLLAPLLLGTVLAIIVAVRTQPVYQSSATLLIESQQVPTSLVSSPLTTYADERIAKIRQQITSRAKLEELIQRNNLYVELRDALPLSDVLGIMREGISVDLVSASAATNSSRGADATIAFTLSFTYPQPVLAQRVAEQLTQEFMAEDKRLRSEQASDTAAFLSRRVDELRARLVRIEDQRRAVRARYNGALPDQVMAGSQSSATLRAEVSRLDAETQGIMQQNSLLAARGQELSEAPGASAQADVRRARAELDRMGAIYSDTHPDLIAAKAAFERMEIAARSDLPKPPGVSTIEAEIQAGRARVSMLSQRRAQLVAAIAAAERLASLTPQAAYELNNLERDYENLRRQYQEIQEKQLEAQVAANLQAEEKGERFAVVDPPLVPYKPLRPDRVKLVLMGIIGGLGAGIALILAFEIVVGPIHGAGAVARLMGEPPLVTIPVMKPGSLPDLLTRFDRAMLWWRGARA